MLDKPQMKKALLISIACIITTVVNAQEQKLNLTNDKTITVIPYWRTKTLLYFQTTSPDTFYTIPLSQLKSLPDKTPLTNEINPDLYIMKFRRGQLNGFWTAIFGAAITSVGAAISKDKVSPVVYGGIGISFIGFCISMGSYGNLKKYYIVKTATPYLVKE